MEHGFRFCSEKNVENGIEIKIEDMIDYHNGAYMRC